MKKYFPLILVGILFVYNVNAQNQNISDIEKLIKRIDKQIEIDMSQADTIVPLFSLKYFGNSASLRQERIKTTRFSYSPGFILRFYLIGMCENKSNSTDANVVLRLNKYDEEEDVGTELYFELSDNPNDTKISVIDYTIRSNTENIITLEVPKNFTGSAVMVAAEIGKE